jgi:GT2 family glycosyltransferase
VVEGYEAVLVRSTNVGFAAGVNLGVAHAQGDAPILVLNPDTRLGVGAVTTLLKTMAETNAGIVGPYTEDEHGHLVHSMRHDPSIPRAMGLGLNQYVMNPQRYTQRRGVDWLMGAVLLIDHRCYESVNGLDESYFLYSEETDLCQRARDLGWPVVYEPRASAMHIGGGSGRNAWTHTLQIVNQVRLYGRRHGTVKTAAYQGLTILSEATWLLRGQRESRASIAALLLPSRRPSVLSAGSSWIPR